MIKRLQLILLTVLALSLSACNPNEPDQDVRHAITILTEDIYEVDYTETILEVEIEANCDWSISKTNALGEGISWILTDVPNNTGSGSAKFQVKVCENDTDQSRNGTLNIYSEQVSAYIDITQAPNPDPNKEQEVFKGYKMPVYQLFKSESYTIDGALVKFENGLAVEKGTDSGKATSVVENALLPGFALNFSETESLIFKIPLTNPLSGDLRFMYGSKGENITSAAAYQWSSDEGKTWHQASSFETTLISTFKSVWFSIPEADMVKAESSLWIKVTGGASDISLLGGCALTKAKAKTSALAPEDSETVVISEGFDATAEANAAFEDAPGYMRSVAGGSWTSGDSFISAANCFARPGFIQIGAYDEADPEKSVQNGSLTLKVGERLAAMGVTEKTSVQMSFQACVIDPEVCIDVMSGNNLLTHVSGMGTDRFGEHKFYLTDIDNSAVLTISSKGKDTGADSRVFIDDLCVTIADASNEPLVLEFDFANSSAVNFAGWEARTGRTDDITKGYYTLNGQTYIFQSAKKSATVGSTWPSFGGEKDPVGQLHMTQASCLGLPMVEGYRLTSITIVTDDSNNSQPLYVESERQNAPSEDTAIKCEPVKGPEYKVDLEGTLMDTIYWLYQGGSGSQAFDIKVLKLTFMPGNNNE